MRLLCDSKADGGYHGRVQARPSAALRYTQRMTLATTDPAVPLDDVRARFRACGLAERPSGAGFVYTRGGGAEARMLLILQAVGRGAQIYLFPEALGRGPGAAQPFYVALEAAGFGIGSKAGPSIGLSVEDDERMTVFWTAFQQLLSAAG